jgi:mono/diheme cytochrome c family protein
MLSTGHESLGSNRRLVYNAQSMSSQLTTSRFGQLRRLAATTLLILIGTTASTALAADSDEGLRLFREKVEPLLKRECYACHASTAKELQGGLLLDSRQGILHGGDTGAAIVPGKSDESLLVQALRHQGDYAMPPEKPRLTESLIADVARWIDLGAPDPRTGEVASPDQARLEQGRQHWAFQPVRRPPLPVVKNIAWLKSPIDAFILARLEERGWAPAPPASRAEWLRRVTFDLTGLPPTPADVISFERDAAEDAYDRVVDRLLASPRYGERWAQHWLDVVRFAETEGYEYDRHIPGAWRFRDYAIAAFNADKPLDRFVREQLAGDEIDPASEELLVASTFHRLGPVRRNAGNPDIALSRNEVLTERTDILGTAFLGLTVGCARCHNHKLEPILQQDYYRLQAFLAATEEHNVSLAPAEVQQAWERETQRLQAEMKRLTAIAKTKSGAEREALMAQVEALDDQLPPTPPTIPAAQNNFAERTKIHVLRRGVWESKGEAVAPRVLSVLISNDVPELPADVSNPRTQLADWIASSDNPLTPRVLVNRIWQRHFGIGLVRTANDFGTHGEAPSHPQLLDWIASEFIEGGWQLKPLQRQIVLSATYRQSSRTAASSAANSVAEQSDPENRLLWRGNRRRLEAEEIRDAMLAIAGRLNLKAGGPSVMPPVDADLVKQLYKPSQWQLPAQESENDRRSIYLIAKRNLRLPFMEAFDAPALLTSCARRESSTHAPQALELLNGTLANELADAFARRLQQETNGEPEAIVERAFELATGTPPTVRQRELSLAFLRAGKLREFALAMFNLNEFLYVP